MNVCEQSVDEKSLTLPKWFLKTYKNRRPRKAIFKENANDLDKAEDESVAGGGEKCPFCDKNYKQMASLRAHKPRVHRGRMENEL